jgi:hypothetical protein
MIFSKKKLMIFDDIFCSSPHENNKFDKKNKLLDATKNNEKKVTNGAPEEGAPLLSVFLWRTPRWCAITNLPPLCRCVLSISLSLPRQIPLAPRARSTTADDPPHSMTPAPAPPPESPPEH